MLRAKISAPPEDGLDKKAKKQRTDIIAALAATARDLGAKVEKETGPAAPGSYALTVHVKADAPA